MTKAQIQLIVVQSPPPSPNDKSYNSFYNRFTEPLITALYQNKDIPVAMYFSGPYLAWLKNKRTESTTVIRDMLKRKQLEILGGGYYDPILPLIPHNDRLGQLEFLSTTVRQILGKRPRGCWLGKGVWDNALALPLTASGLDYTFVDQEAFKRQGINGEGLHMPHSVESQGKSVVVFPFDNRFQQWLVQGDLTSVATTLEKDLSRSGRVISMVLEPGYNVLENSFTVPEFWSQFFQILRDQMYSGELSTPSQYLKNKLGAFATSYFMPSTGAELAKMGGVALQGGDLGSRHFRQCFSEFPEVLNLYSKMMQVHLLAYQIRGDRYRKRSILEELWKAQSHHFYYSWYGEGVLNSSLRGLAYRALLESEAMSRDKTKFQSSIHHLDVNFDGSKETLFVGKSFNFAVTSVGACLYAMEEMKKFWNFGDTLQTYFLPQSNLRPRHSFYDRILENRPGSELMTLSQDAGGWAFSDFKTQSLTRDENQVCLSGVGILKRNRETHNIKINKSFRFDEHSVLVTYELETLSAVSLTTNFGVEFNFSFLDDEKIEVVTEGSDGGLPAWEDRGQVKKFHVLDRSTGISLDIGLPEDCLLSWAPLTAQSPLGTLVQHGCTFLPRWNLVLTQGQKTTFQVHLNFSQIHR